MIMKRALSFVLSLVLLIGLVPMQAFAVEGASEELNAFQGKKVSILSHSMSTYAGVSNSTAANSTIGNNDVYYTEGRHAVYLKDTWWQQTIDALDMELLVNNSWSGSCVFMPRKGEASVGYGDRAVNLHNDHTGEEPDLIFVYLGCNDFAYYKDSFGKADDVNYDAIIRDNGDGTFTYAAPATTCEAYAIMLHKAANRYPDAEIYCITSTARRETDYTGDTYPDAGQPTEYSAQLQQIAKYYGYPVVDLENAITKDVETFDKYMGDKRAHANALGMDRITNELLSVLLGKDAQICHVTSADGTVREQAVLMGGRYNAEVELQDGHAVVVAMNGVDITQEAFSDGKITISNITGDIEIHTIIQRDPLSFRWELQQDALVSVGTDDNGVKKLAGTIANGVLSNSRYELTASVVLKHDLPWEVEWQFGGNWRGCVFTSEPVQGTKDMVYLSRTVGGQLCIGTWTGQQYDNYGVDLSGLDDQLHSYRLENRISADGSNMVWVYVDGEEIGPMNRYFIGSKDHGTTSDWISGKDFVFSYISMDGHALRECKLNYLQVQECIHTHAPNVTAPTCTEQGYTTYTCACGDSYMGDYVDATGHNYDSIVCTVCGKKYPDEIKGLDSTLAVTMTPENYLTISNPFTEKLACAPNLVTYGDGKFAVAYLADDVNTVETESSTTIVCRLGLFDVEAPEKGTFFDIATAGQTIGSVTIGSKAPYEPNLLKLSDDALLVLFNIRDTAGNYVYYSARFDTASNTVTSYQPLTLDGKSWTPGNIAASYNTLAGNDISASGPASSMVFTSRIIQHDGYYYGYCGGICSGFSGMLVRSTDGINWTSVMAPEALPEMAGVIECGFEFLGDDVYFCMRDISSGVYHCSYDFKTGEQLTGTSKLSGITTSKPTAFAQNGNLYLIVNKATGDDNTVGRRNTALFYQVNPKICRLTLVRQVFCADGVAYHSVVNLNGTNYWSFHTDARRINPYTQGRSNLAFLQIPELYASAGGSADGVLDLNDYSDMFARGCITVATNTWQAGAVNMHYQIPLADFGDFDTVTITANREQKAYIAFFTDRMTQNGTIAYAEGWADQLIMEPGAVQTLTIPRNAEYLYILNNNAAGANLLPESVVFSKNTTGPVIIQQPESVQQELGKKFSITVKAEGEGLTYQWYVKESGAKAFKVSSNKTSSYAYSMQHYMDNRKVYCVVTDKYGNSVQTETATITRPPVAVTIIDQPQDARVNVGEKFSISPKVEGEGLTYQWYVKEAGAKAWKVSSNKTSAYAYTTQNYMIGRQVYCVITDKYGNSVTTDVATISLPTVELKILTQPTDVYASLGEKFSIAPEVQGEGLTYQWYYKNAGGKSFAASSNKTSAYAYSMQSYMDGRSVYCVITDQYGNTVQTDVATIHVK